MVILFIDISTPRNIDPEIRKLNGMTLIDIDCLKDNPIELSPAERKRIAQAEKLVLEQVDCYFESSHKKHTINIVTDDCQPHFIDS